MPSHPHSSALLTYLIHTYSHKNRLAAYSPPQPSANATSLELSVRKLALEQSRAAASSASRGTSETSSTDDDEHEEGGRATSSSADSSDESSEEDKINSVLELLGDESIDEDERPDALKDLLSSILVMPLNEPVNLDPIILSLLHRYKEDMHPSGNPVPPLPNHGSTTPGSRQSLSRSSSLRRGGKPTGMGLSLPPPASASNGGSSSAPSSPFLQHRNGAASPSLRLPASGQTTPSHSPWSSPRLTAATAAGNPSLSASAVEFKFSAGAGEFRPSGTSSPLAPGTPIRSHSPNPNSSIPLAQQAQAQWAATSSPLGTPKYATGARTPSGSTTSAVSSPSYFPRHLGENVAAQLKVNRAVKPARLPWADGSEDDFGDEEDEDDEEADDPEPREYERGAGYIDTGSPWAGSPAHTPGGGVYGAHGMMIDPAWAHAQQYGGGVGHQGFPPPQNEQEWAAQQMALQAQHLHHQQQQHHPQYQQQSYGTYSGGALWDPTHGYGEDLGLPQPAGYPDSHTPTYEGAGMTLPGPAPGEMPSIEFANELSGPSGLGGMGAYRMSPFDHLLSIFSSGGELEMEESILEEALEKSGYDVDRAVEYLIETQPVPTLSAADAEGGSTAAAPHFAPPPPGYPLLAPLQPNRTVASSGSRPLVVSRDSFDGYGGRAGPNGGQRYGSRPQTPTNGGSEGRGVGGRVCRYYLSGNCLRSDCKFSHDVGKAVCKFWLRGHCLKGDGRCDFLHSIPPIMRADFEQRAQQRAAQIAGMGYEEELYQQQPDAGPDLDFPTLGEAPRARRQPGGPSTRAVQLDPARTRFSGAVKFGPKIVTPVAPVPPPSAPVVTRDNLPKARRSARINLRPPALLPTLPTGQALAALYIRYRSSFLELGANRNKCLARAAECWKRGDGKGAREASRRGQDFQRQIAIEGRDSASKIVEERKRVLKEAVLAEEDPAGDGTPHRKVRGQERGGGVCLGVVAQSQLARGERQLTVEERTEVALDLHALHTDEAISFMGDFLQALEREKFAGLAFVVIGQSKHSGSSATDKGEAAGRLRLEQACTEFASDQGWAWQAFGGILAVDCLR